MYENFRSINSFPWEKKKSWSIPHVKSLVGKYIVCIICKIIYTNNIGFFFLRILHTVHLPPIVITKCFFMWFSCQSFFDRLKKKKWSEYKLVLLQFSIFGLPRVIDRSKQRISTNTNSSKSDDCLLVEIHSNWTIPSGKNEQCIFDTFCTIIFYENATLLHINIF